MKPVKIKIGYYPEGGGVTGKQLGYIQALLEKEYGDAYHLLCYQVWNTQPL